MTPTRPKRPTKNAPGPEEFQTGQDKAPEDPQTSTRPQADSFPIVAIGASAGGLEAFTALLQALPPDIGMALVLVPHLDPHRESAFSQILSRATKMPVTEITNELTLEPNHIYVIPPNCDLTISKGVLYIENRHEVRGANMTIDIFLRSLAADQGKNAIAVILSGTGSDGTLGLAAIKSEGGITFAQDTRSAKYDGMPASAIASGHVDFVLSARAIAQQLIRLRHHGYITGIPQVEEDEHTREAQMSQIFHLLRRVTHVDFSEYKAPTIRRRIQRRMALHKLHKLSDYSAMLHLERSEVRALYHDLLINVTSFFRNPETFDALKQEVYPVILSRRQTSRPE